jgi:hypothetical protein
MIKFKLKQFESAMSATKTVGSIINKGRTRQQIRRWWFTRRKNLNNQSPAKMVLYDPKRVIAYAKTFVVKA